ncbi:hypothetical protein MGI18_15540 [Bacillus sp. OVS6]|nr:hypothetical protein MGI18_15540 [Bacillus sp. OVS6]
MLGDCIIPTIPDGNYYECTTTGTTGSSEPAWSIISNGIVVDGSVIWTVRRIIKWKETGQKAAFKPYGLIQS